MKLEHKEPKKQLKINTRPIFTLLIGLGIFSVILVITLLETSNEVKQAFKLTGKPLEAVLEREGLPKEDSPAEVKYDSEMLAVVKEINAEKMQITLFDIASQETFVLNYTGGSDIKDKYGQIISISQVSLGLMTEVGYQKEDKKLIKMQTSEKAWEYIGVHNLSINRSDRIMKIVQNKYKYTDDIIIVDGDTLKSVTDLAEQDELTVRGYGETIWSVTVTKGHGVVKLTDQEAFLGGNVTIGYETMQQVTEDMRITVGEGNFNLTVENGKYSGTKNITVRRNEETVVSLSGLGPKAGQHGLVNFQIMPFGAELVIDKEPMSYSDAIELSYGDHNIQVSLGGYMTYNGILKVDASGKKIKIDLPEAQSSEEVTVVETGTSDEEVTNSETEYNDWSLPVQNVSSENDSQEEDELIVDEEHSIFVQSPVGASVYLNGEFMGISPGKFKKAIGSHVLTFIREGYETISYPVEVEDDGLDTYLSFSEQSRKN